MSIARTSSVCRHLRSMPSPICRFYSSTTKDAPNTRNPKYRQAQPTANRPMHPQNREQAKKERPYKIYIPQSQFYTHISPSGQLHTSPEIWSFLQETGIEYDNSKAERLDLGSDSKQIQALFGCQIQYGPYYILNPYDLHHIRPGGTAMLPMVMSKYRQKLEEEPLWVFTTSHGDHPIVKSLMVKRLSGAVWRAAKDLGFSMDGPKGTVMIKVYDPVRVSRAPAHILGEAVAKAVQRRWQQHLREIAKKTEPRTSSRIKW
ncbi:hypothetical protein HYE68_000658 [Fusarium pseudograminearum]|nr:hypothetical protein HYE68_000658 [Fusarium pseudograminearum]